MKEHYYKTKLSTIALILVLTISAILVALPVATAQETEGRKTTYPYVGAVPDPAGVNQQILLHVGITDNLAGPQYGWEGLSLTIEKPDGSTETITGIRTDATGGTGVPYTPTLMGTYYFQTHFPEQLNPASSRVGPEGMVMEASTSEKLALNVIDKQIEYYPGHSLPDEYWTRPIDAQLRERYTIAAHWPFIPRNKYTPYNEGPESPHILWTEQLYIGGLVGGTLGSTDLESLGYHGMECGDAYEGKFGGRPQRGATGWGTAGPMILAGRLYYRVGAYDLPMVYHCVDLHTGEELWTKTFLDNQSIAFGQLFYWDSYNYHGVYPYLWVTTGGRGQPENWYAFDATTGEWMFTVENMPSGTTRWGPKGEIYRFQVDQANGWMALWNMSALGSMGGSWGSEVHLHTLDAAADTEAAARAWSWNVTIPADLPGRVLEIYFGDRIIGGSATTKEVTSWGLNLNSTAGSMGASLFKETWFAPAEWDAGNVSISWEIFDLHGKDGVMVVYARQLRKYYGFSMDTGKNLWETDPEHYLNNWVGTECTMAYGKFISTGVSGITNCYDAKTGVLQWNYSSVDPYQEFLWSNNWWTKPMFVTDGKLYLGHMEHSAIDPKPRGAPFICLDIETGDEIWRADGLFRQTYWGSPVIIGDSIIATMDTYDQRVYAIGKGPSETTVTIQNDVVPFGSNVMIKGTVMDVSPGTEDYALTSRFPKGIPAVADESMTEWMLYVYKQFERPTDVEGVEVFLKIQDPNGDWYSAYVTTDEDGKFSHVWAPAIVGEYRATALFEGSKSYYPSQETITFVIEAPAALGVPSAEEIAQTTVNTMPAYPAIPEIPSYLTIDLIILVIAAVGVVIGLIAYMALRKQK
jgi:hypothetical protein